MYPGHFDANRTAYIMANTGITISFGELEAASNQISHLFRDLGVTRGDSIAMCLENHPVFFKICWAAHRSGIYFTAISYRLQAEEVEYILNDCGAKILITSKHLGETFNAFRGQLTNHPICFMLDGEAPGAQSFETSIKPY